MSAKDISRYLLQPRKRYSSVRMQQGRVILDSDWNESERIDDEEARRTLLDLLCSKGTPNQGFLVGDVEPTFVVAPEGQPPGTWAYDFSIAGGSFYLGGLRFEAPLDEPETFLRQSDWLRIDADPANLPAPPSPADLALESGGHGERYDLVYLKGWEQSVTAVEDSELLERALGGPDTSLRIKRMRRVEVLADVAGTCSEAFAQLKSQLTDAGVPPEEPHVFDPASCELKSKARLKVTFTNGVTEDPCKPEVTAGFLGAENETIRIELTAPDRFIWGLDNASPYYRVQVVEEEGELVKVKFLTRPRDQSSQPLAGQAVEIHPWGALLPNSEKVAELQGHLATVATSYDPETASLTIAEPVPTAWLAWLDDPSHAGYLSARDPDDRQKYFYLRLWTGGSGDDAQPDHAFTPATPVSLHGTGLELTFSDQGLPGDSWILAARPHTPDLVVPWELMDGAPAVGTRFFFAVLALIRWSVATDPDGQETVIGTVRDCRPKFRPLCEIRGCCTVTVGDGVASHGDFSSIQAAVDSLPAAGGKICLLPGIHQGGVEISGRQNVRIHGCDEQTLVIPAEESRTSPIFHVVDSSGVTLEHMDMATLEGVAVLAEGGRMETLEDLEIGHTRILGFTQAIRVNRGTQIHVHHNRLRVLDRVGGGVGVLLAAEDSVIERNDLGVQPAEVSPPLDGDGDRPQPEDPCEDPERVYGNLRFLLLYLEHAFGLLFPLFPFQPYRALGGIQIGAGSERVKVLENRIHGGAGDGVTLGGGALAPAPGEGDEGPRRVEVSIPRGGVSGYVFESGTGRAGVNLLFRSADGSTTTSTSGEGGWFLVPEGPADYTVESTTPGLEVERAGVSVDSLFEFSRVDLHVVQVEEEPAEGLAFLSEVQIDRNEITGMGLCGIGFPRPERRFPVIGAGSTLAAAPTGSTRAAVRGPRALLGDFGNPVLTLGIHRNRIVGCLQNPFDDELEALAQRRGLGGISLGYCENLTISGNSIHENGRTHIDPVCGIFVGFAVQGVVHHNRVIDNGPRTTRNAELERGRRGGIVLLAASFGISDAPLRRAGRGASGRPAARVHDNVVRQPAGRALRIFAAGPVSVADNSFETELAAPEEPELGSGEALAGAVLIMNFGRGGRLASGLTLVHGNQTHLGEEARSLTATAVFTEEDLGFDANQTRAASLGLPLTDTVSFLVDTWLTADTVRASDSRFKEPGAREGAFIISLISVGERLNNTTHNQGDHCIFAISQNPALPAVDTGNLELDGRLCRRLGLSIRPSAETFTFGLSG